MLFDNASNNKFSRGAPRFVEALWIFVSAMFVTSWLPGSAWRCTLLRLFGARIGRGVVIKPGVQVKFPWRLHIGSHTWIGEHAWIDNLAVVTIGDHACISQGVYLCTGNHDWSRGSFDLITQPILIEDGAWVGAFSKLAPGTIMRKRAVLTLGSVGSRELEPNTVYRGNPAKRVMPRPNNAKETSNAEP
ncbi:Galactoside O-acetyltransferase (plasmid) [Roseivivax sp. THAF40]|nr:Galactoside O-acetyltransferase [Roseivivax sp. THAF40]